MRKAVYGLIIGAGIAALGVAVAQNFRLGNLPQRQQRLLRVQKQPRLRKSHRHR